MTWSYDPTKLESNPKDQVRLLIGDVLESEPIVQDEEIEYALSQHKNIYAAAAFLCDSIAAMFGRKVDTRTGDVEDKFSQRAAAYARRAQELRKEAKSQTLALAKPLAGALRVAQKKMAELDTGRAKPFFRRGQFEGRF